MSQTIVHIQALLASPSDLNAEREIVGRVIESMNQEWRLNFRVQVDLVRWETHVAPGFGDNPQSVINEQLGDKAEIFIGMLWSKIGTATLKAASGTIEEFERAYARFTANPESVNLMFYFKIAALRPDQIDTHQLQQVKDFKKELAGRGGLYRDFDGVVDFEPLLRLDLANVVRKRADRLAKLPETSRNASTMGVTTSAVQDESVVTSSADTEEVGLLEYLELGNSASAELIEVLGRMSEATLAMNHDIVSQTEAVNDLIKAPSIPIARLLFDTSADTLRKYANKIALDTPRFAQTHTDLLRSVSGAATLTGEFGPSQDRARDAMKDVREMQSELERTRLRMQELTAHIQLLPSMTGKFRKAKRNVIAQLRNLDLEFDMARARGTAVIEAVNDLLA